MGFLNKSNAVRQILRRCHRGVEHPNCLACFHGKWPTKEQKKFEQHMRVIPNFISEAEEKRLHEEIEPYLSRMRNKSENSDDTIHVFRERESKKWYTNNRDVLERVRQVAFDGDAVPYVQVLDLAADGVVEPHVDCTVRCGHTISGISLLSDSVMRLVRTEKYQPIDKDAKSVNTKGENTNANEVDVEDQQPQAEQDNQFYADMLLPRRSLYIMSHTARYNFTHEILANDKSEFKGNPVQKTRRISIVCRNDP